MERLATSLPVEGPYRLGLSLSVLTMGRGNPALRHNATQAQLTLNTPAGRVALAAEHAGDTLRVLAEGPGAAWVEPHLPGLFGLEDDPAGFAPTGRLKRIADAHAGLRLVRLPAVFDRLVQVVLQQLIAFKDACRGWRRLVQTYGDEVPGSDGLWHAPTAERLARLAVADLMACDILPKHARLILTLAKQAAAIERLWNAGRSPTAGDANSPSRQADVADGPHVAGDPATLRSEPPPIDALSDFLLRQPGVGPWTVGYLRGAGLGDADALVLGDYGHPHHVAYFFTGEERSDDAQMVRLLAPYQPHRFRVLTLLIVGAPAPPRRGPRRASLRERFR